MALSKVPDTGIASRNTKQFGQIISMGQIGLPDTWQPEYLSGLWNNAYIRYNITLLFKKFYPDSPSSSNPPSTIAVCRTLWILTPMTIDFGFNKRLSVSWYPWFHFFGAVEISSLWLRSRNLHTGPWITINQSRPTSEWLQIQLHTSLILRCHFVLLLIRYA